MYNSVLQCKLCDCGFSLSHCHEVSSCTVLTLLVMIWDDTMPTWDEVWGTTQALWCVSLLLTFWQSVRSRIIRLGDPESSAWWRPWLAVRRRGCCWLMGGWCTQPKMLDTGLIQVPEQDGAGWSRRVWDFIMLLRTVCNFKPTNCLSLEFSI